MELWAHHGIQKWHLRRMLHQRNTEVVVGFINLLVGPKKYVSIDRVNDTNKATDPIIKCTRQSIRALCTFQLFVLSWAFEQVDVTGHQLLIRYRFGRPACSEVSFDNSGPGVTCTKNTRSRIHRILETIMRTIMRMDQELTQMASLLDEKDLSGEQLDRISAQVTEITCQKEHILGLLPLCPAQNGRTIQPDNEKVLNKMQ